MAWFDGFDDATRSAVAGKGWDKLEAPAAFAAAFGEARDAQAKLTIPADEIARVPKDPASPEWAVLYDKLGVPKDPAGYKLDEVKHKDGTAAPQPYTDFVRTLAHDLKLPASAAAPLAQKVINYLEGQEAAKAGADQARAAAEMVRLETMWGGQKDTNLFLASKAMEALKLPASVAEAFQKNADAMEAMRNLGVRMQEAGYVGGGAGGGNPGQMTKDQALARIEELKRDRAWTGRWMNGGADEVRLFTDLHKVASGGPQR